MLSRQKAGELNWGDLGAPQGTSARALLPLSRHLLTPVPPLMEAGYLPTPATWDPLGRATVAHPVPSLTHSCPTSCSSYDRLASVQSDAGGLREEGTGAVKAPTSILGGALCWTLPRPPHFQPVGSLSRGADCPILGCGDNGHSSLTCPGHTARGSRCL